MIVSIINVIHTLARILIFAIIVQVLLSYFLSPYHPVRRTLDQMVEPMLRPIRRMLPATGPLDFSPLVLVILIQIAEWLLTSVLLRLA